MEVAPTFSIVLLAMILLGLIICGLTAMIIKTAWSTQGGKLLMGFVATGLFFIFLSSTLYLSLSTDHVAEEMPQAPALMTYQSDSSLAVVDIARSTTTPPRMAGDTAPAETVSPKPDEITSDELQSSQTLPHWIQHTDDSFSGEDILHGKWTLHNQPSIFVIKSQLWATTQEADAELKQIVNQLVKTYYESRLDFQIPPQHFQTLTERAIQKEFTETVPMTLIDSYQSDMYRSYAEVELTPELDRHIAGTLRTTTAQKPILIVGLGLCALTSLGFLSSLVLRYHQNHSSS